MISSLERNFIFRYFFLFVILFCFESNAVYSQQSEDYNLNSKSFSRFLDDGKQLALDPLHWETSDWLTFSAVTGGTLLLTTVDTQVKNEALETPYKNTFPMIIGKWAGEPLATFSIAGGLYLYGLASEDFSIKRIGFEIAESFIYAGTINLIMKASIGRFRPYIQKGSDSFRPFTIWNKDNLSLRAFYRFIFSFNYFCFSYRQLPS